MDFSNYLIVTDLDGTLFDREQKIPQKSLDALEYFKSRGGVFTFATGRDIMFIKRRFPFLIDLINAPAIMSNGASVYDFLTDECLFKFCLNKSFACDILRRVNQRFPDAPFEISTSEQYIVINPNEHFVKRFTNMTDIVTFSDGVIIPDGDILRVNFIDKNIERINLIADYVNSLDINFEFEKVFSDTFIFEILPAKATKGNALKFLNDKYQERKIIAAGDWYNDMSVLKIADVPVCPINAAQEIKDFCKFVLCHCDDGIISDIVALIENGLI